MSGVAVRREWPVLTGLLLLSAVPVLAGVLRVTELAGGAAATAENARFVDAPVPVLVHIVGATTFCVVGAFQFSPRIRARHRGWHRIAGRVLVVCGLAAAVSGLWMTAFSDLPPIDGPLLSAFRFAFGSAMAACLVLGILAARRRDIAAHSAWMTRGYAIGIAAGTQFLFFASWVGFVGEPGETTRALLQAGAWMLNLVVAELVVRRRASARAHPEGVPAR